MLLSTPFPRTMNPFLPCSIGAGTETANIRRGFARNYSKGLEPIPSAFLVRFNCFQSILIWA